MSEPTFPKVEISEARANLSGIISQVNAEHLPRIITRYGQEVAVLLPPGRYVAVRSDAPDSRTMASLARDSLTEAVPET